MPTHFKGLLTLVGIVWAASIYSATTVGQSPATMGDAVTDAAQAATSTAKEAPVGFDNRTNGFVSQTTFDAVREIFAEHEEIDEGLGPLYNADSCASCHSNPVTGAISQVTELRAGTWDGSRFTDQDGGSLINDLALNANIQERVLGTSNVRTLRTSLNTLGDGFVEAIADSTLVAIANSQPSGMRGLVIQVPVLEGFGATAVARFGWKNQHASLISFSADAYLNEMGITSPLQPTENSSNGKSVAAHDGVADPEDAGDDIFAFADFMRATKAPPRDTALANTSGARAGSQVFDAIGCNVCHVRTIVTAPPGSSLLGGTATVHAALGNKIIHPFSDFLLHNVGTGDGIVQNGGSSTRNRMRTPPLWGVRSRHRLMHDGASLTAGDAILRHAGEASAVINNYKGLSETNKSRLIAFLNSL
jgi:CxxC motif-containing protein (DUF1111 family)